MKYLLIIVLLVAVLVTAGCVSENKNTVVPGTAKLPFISFTVKNVRIVIP